MTTQQVTISRTGTVLVDGHEIGEVRKDTRNYATRPGQYGSRTVWVAVPLSRSAHASTSGCSTYTTRREAVDALTQGTYGPL